MVNGTLPAARSSRGLSAGLLAAFFVAGLGACMPKAPEETPAPGTGGRATGGSNGGGGSPATGGAPATGGSAATGGAPNTGGSSATGGTPATGGAPATGGKPGTGGASGTGGSSGDAKPPETGPAVDANYSGCPTVANWVGCENPDWNCAHRAFENCIACHPDDEHPEIKNAAFNDPDHAKLYQTLLGKSVYIPAACPIKTFIVPGKPMESLVYVKMTTPPTACGRRMPIPPSLPDDWNIAVMCRWIAAGAPGPKK